MRIFVNATAATHEGGLKSIVDQFVNGIPENDTDNEYYIFINPKYKQTNKPFNCKFIEIEAKSALKRIYWDLFGMKRWSSKNNVKPDKILSLQNTGVNFDNIQQYIYLHTPLPFVRFNWNILSKKERGLWFYKHLYPYFIKSSIKGNTFLIVQSTWLKEEVCKYFNINPSRVLINIPSYDINNLRNLKEPKKTQEKLFFYPAADYKYKNHEIIINALSLLKNRNPKKYKEIKVAFTLTRNSYVYRLASKAGVLDKVEFLGLLDKTEMYSFYSSSNAVLFPSYIETFGLPLIEAASFGKQIYCTSEKYADEVIGEYIGVKFIDAFDTEAWMKILEEPTNYYKPYKNDNQVDSWSDLFRRMTS
ncbi:glycosyltransferase [Rossellomorea sp. NS-SX7]|uniref:glycosyltransferase n=1 Tax=Rossellomorea sp. NS-SX7 TaxID=3463856 RepID=UPI004059EB05